MAVRVAIAGSGVVSGYGEGRRALFDGVWSGRRAVRARERTASFDAPTTVAAEVPGLDRIPADDQALWLAVSAAREALDRAGVGAASTDLLVSSTKGSLAGIRGGGDGEGYGVVARLASRLEEALGVRRLVASVSCACSSGVLALAQGARQILRGHSDRVLVVGVDVLNEFIVRGFGALNALDPELCRPFDRDRRGISLGEGAAAVVLSRHEGEAEGCWITGFGGASDAYHATSPDPEGRGFLLAGGRALDMAGISPQDVDAVHLHGTGTLANDSCEATGLARLFDGATAPAFGSKGHTGHTLGAAGILETLVAAEAVRRGTLPGNAGLVDSGVDGGLDLVRGERRLPARSGTRRALKTANGFGGLLGALVIEVAASGALESQA